MTSISEDSMDAIAPDVICRHVMLSVEFRAPRLPGCGDALGEVVVRAGAGEVAAEEGEDIVDVRQVKLRIEGVRVRCGKGRRRGACLDGNVVYPGHDAFRVPNGAESRYMGSVRRDPPFRENGRLEYE
jgi:hypothetical protein